MTGITLPAAAALAWLLTPFLSGAFLARSDRARDAIGRHLPLCLTAGWLGLAALVWGATALDTGAGLSAFLVGGPLGGLSIWSRSPGGGDEPPEEPVPPQWDWDRFERDLRDYETDRLVGPRSS
jgi:hypothetical protein